MNKQPVSQPKKKILPGKTGPIIGFGILGLGILWVVITAIIPLARGNGADNYSGLRAQLANDIIEVTRMVNGPHSPSPMPRFMFSVRVDEVRPVSKEEVIEFCKNPAYITNDPNDRHYYTVIVTERYLLSLKSTTTTYIGCNHTDYIYTEVFDYPEGLDTRVQLPLPN